MNELLQAAAIYIYKLHKFRGYTARMGDFKEIVIEYYLFKQQLHSKVSINRNETKQKTGSLLISTEIRQTAELSRGSLSPRYKI